MKLFVWILIGVVFYCTLKIALILIDKLIDKVRGKKEETPNLNEIIEGTAKEYEDDEVEE